MKIMTHESLVHAFYRRWADLREEIITGEQLIHMSLAILEPLQSLTPCDPKCREKPIFSSSEEPLQACNPDPWPFLTS